MKSKQSAQLNYDFLPKISKIEIWVLVLSKCANEPFHEVSLLANYVLYLELMYINQGVEHFSSIYKGLTFCCGVRGAQGVPRARGAHCARKQNL